MVIKKLAIFGALAILLLLVATGGTYLFAYHIAKSELLSGSSIADTIVGPIEYVQIGAGPDVVIIHGTPGGYDQFMSFAGVIADAGYRVLVYSRPGYLRTPISVGESVGEQAAALDALRERLMINKLTVIGISGGGPNALKYAINYPDRTKAIVLVAALSGELPPLADDNVSVRPFGLIDDMRFLLGYSFPEKLMPRLGTQEDADGALIHARTRVMMAKDLFGSLGFSTLRNTGYLNDARQFYRQSLNLRFDQVTSPTLLIYGENDRTVPPAHGELIENRLGDESQLVILPKAGHALTVTHAATVIQHLLDFLSNDHCATDNSC